MDKAQLKQTKIEFEKKHPGSVVGAIKFSDGRLFWVKTPDREQWFRFKEMVIDPKRKKVSMENLVVTCILDPVPDVMSKMFDKEPALAETLADKIATLAGHDDKAEFVDFPDA